MFYSARLVWISLSCLGSGACAYIEPVVYSGDVKYDALIRFDAAIPQSAARPLYRMNAAPLRTDLIEAFRSGKFPSGSGLDVTSAVPMAAPAQPNALASMRPPTVITPAPPPSTFDGNSRLRIDPDGGFELTPSFDALAEQSIPEPLNAKKILSSVSRQILEKVVPPDPLTSASADQARVLRHARVQRTDTLKHGPPSQPELVYISARRHVDDVSVDGPGSRIMVGFDANATVRAAVYHWKTPTVAGTASPLPEVVVKREVQRQLLAVTNGAGVYVQRVEIAYYDNGTTLQPVYRFVAEFGQRKESYGAPDIIVGYVPFANALEPVPNLANDRVDEAKTARQAIPASSASRASTPGTIDVGRYVTRDLNTGWASSADAFWLELSGPAGQLKFNDAQHGSALAAHFTTDKDQFVNGVDLALLEAHGFPQGFATLGDSDDRVYIEAHIAPNHAYGSFAGGKLKHWILHSCNAVSTQAEFEGWLKPWWHIFRGLSSVVGYRSVMFIDDLASSAVAPSLAAKAPVVPAWFNAVASLNIYADDSWAVLQCAGNQPMGRPAAITVCKHADATVEEGGPEDVPCLEGWWVDDDLTVIEPHDRETSKEGDSNHVDP